MQRHGWLLVILGSLFVTGLLFARVGPLARAQASKPTLPTTPVLVYPRTSPPPLDEAAQRYRSMQPRHWRQVMIRR